MTARIYYRVYASQGRHSAFVNQYPTQREAAALVRHLCKRYGSQGVEFWHGTENVETSTAWAPLRNRLRAQELPATWAAALQRPHNSPQITRTEVRGRKTSPKAEIRQKALAKAAAWRPRAVSPAPQEVDAQAVAKYLARGGAITFCRPDHAAAPSGRRQRRRP